MNVRNHSNHLNIQYFENIWWEDANELERKVYDALTLINTGGGAQSSSSIGESRFLSNGTSNEPDTSL